jgi:ribonuclease D
VKLLVRARTAGQSPPTASLLTQGWRARHLLPEMLAILDGRRSLRIVDVAGDTPFELAETKAEPRSGE